MLQVLLGYCCTLLQSADQSGNWSMIQACGKGNTPPYTALHRNGCIAGSSGRICAGCEKSHYKSGKECVSCPSGPTKYLIYIFSPMLLLAFFPLLKYLIGGGRTPSLYVANSFFQITAVFGGFAINWPADIKEILKAIGVFNFNWNLMFFSCHDPRPTFLEDWVMFQLLPVYYLLFFFGRHYFYKHLWPAAWADDNTCFTFCGRSAKSFFGGTGWMASLHASLFMGNLLWLATLNKSLTMFACGQLPNGDYYLVDDPTVTCYAGDHLRLMILAIAALCIYTLGWPLFLAVAFRIAFRKKLLLGSAQFAGLLGFLYKRYEIQWFWWHTIIIAHKLAIVLTKIFLFNTFYQCPIAIVVTLVMMVLQSFARAYESTMLDRLQMAGYSTQFCLLFLGLLFATDKGSSKLNNFLANTFFVMFWSMVVACSCAVYRDLKRYYRLDRLAAISAEHDLGINPKEIVVSTLHAWVSREPSADEYARFREFLAARKKYTCPPHLKEPFLMLSKGATTLLEFMCYPAEHWESSAGTLGSKLLYFISKANENQSVEMQPGEVIKEEFDETLSSTLSFCLRDLKEQWHIRRQPDFEETDEPT